MTASPSRLVSTATPQSVAGPAAGSRRPPGTLRVKRRTGSEDRRQVLLALTPKADALLARLSAAHRDELQRLAPLLQTLLTHFKPET